MMPRPYGSSRQHEHEQQQQQSPELSPLHISSPPSNMPSEWASTSSSVGGHINSRDRIGAQFGFGHGPQQWQHQQQQQHQNRSSPIAIIRNPLNENIPFRPGISDDEDEDSSVDVERDALKLKAKYGSNVMAVSLNKADSMVSKVLLRAPYLGSLPQSDTFRTHDMPPMSLTEGGRFDYYHNESGSAAAARSGYVQSYGSLRESHQQGLFLDGPASYRDVRSGQIRRLDHRRRFSHCSSPPGISIGERMQQSRKLKELEKQKHGEKAPTGPGKSAGTSSLSVMMDEVSKNESDQSATKTSLVERSTSEEPNLSTNWACPQSTPLLHMGTQNFPRSGGIDEDVDMQQRRMMSTSLTGLELLMTSKKLAVPAAARNEHGGEVVGNFAQMVPPLSLATHNNGQVNPGNSCDPPDGHHFQALSRSMSDPTPHLHNPAVVAAMAMKHNLHSATRQLQQSHHNHQSVQSSPGWSPYAASQMPSVTAPMVPLPPSISEQQATTGTYNATPIQLTSDHNPEIDGAFDMDLE